MSRPLIVYHANCADGFGAAWAAWRLFGKDADYVACQYGDALPSLTGLTHCYIVDFSFPRDILIRAAREHQSCEITVLDHHETARDALVPPWPQGTDNLRIDFDMTHSGARLAWDHFHGLGVPLPKIISYIEDRDLWWFRLPDSKAYSAALASYPFDFAVWDEIYGSTDSLILEGRGILRYIEKRVADTVALAKTGIIAGYAIPVVNCPAFLASEVGNALAVGERFAAMWSASDTEVFWSLRSSPDGMNVAQIAKQFGGGGHKHAAGFKTLGAKFDYGRLKDES